MATMFSARLCRAEAGQLKSSSKKKMLTSLMVKCLARQRGICGMMTVSKGQATGAKGNQGNPGTSTKQV